MLKPSMPDPKIRRLERVEVVDGPWAGRRGAVLWCDRPTVRDRRTRAWLEWVYCVYCPDPEGYGSFRESNLRPLGEFDDERAHRGTRHEIGFDSILEDDHSCVEGSYRVPGRHWEVFFFSKEDVPELRHEFGTWQSEITGVEFEVPRAVVLDRGFMIRAMSGVFGIEGWVEVRGPDSPRLK